MKTNNRILLSIFFCFPLLVFGQNEHINHISVLGENNYKFNFSNIKVEITFMENTNKCDPALGIVPVNEQIKHFRELLAIKQINFNDFNEVKKDIKESKKNKIYQYLTSDYEKVFNILDIAQSQRLEMVTAKYIFDQCMCNGGDEDIAVAALQNARHRADKIAKNLGKKVTRVLSIDDDTSRYEQNYSDENIDNYLQNFQVYYGSSMRNSIDKMYKDGVDRAERTGRYFLHVTFEVQ